MDDHLRVTNIDRIRDDNRIIDSLLEAKQTTAAARYAFFAEATKDLSRAHVVLTMGQVEQLAEFAKIKERQATRYRGALAKGGLFSLRPPTKQERVERIQQADELATMDMARGLELSLQIADALGERCLQRSVRLLRELRDFGAEEDARGTRLPDINGLLEDMEDEWTEEGARVSQTG